MTEPQAPSRAEAQQRADDIHVFRAELARLAEEGVLRLDAGPDALQLRQKYPDRTRFVLLKGSVRPTLRDRRGGNQQPTGSIAHLATASLNVPHALHSALEGIHPRPEVEPAGENRISAVVQVGQRLEPWISGLESVSKVRR